MMQYLDRLRETVWEGDLAAQPRNRAVATRVGRIVWAIAADMMNGQITLRAMGMVYTTLMSIVPLLAFAFSVLKGFGVHNQMRPVIAEILAPLGEQGVQITEYVVGFVDRIQVGVLGSVGLALLIYTVLSLMQKVEESLNYTWRVPTTRNFTRRFSGYLSVLMVGPLLTFSSIGLSASIAAIPGMDMALKIVGFLLPYFMMMATFALIYKFMINAKVRAKPAMIGGLVAAVSWYAAGFVFTSIVVASSSYTAVYSTFAGLLLLLLWLYLAWLIMMVGATVAYYVQHPNARPLAGGDDALNHREREAAALRLAQAVALDFYTGKGPSTPGRIAEKLGLPLDVLTPLLIVLERAQIILQAGSGYAPARPFESVTPADVVEAVRNAHLGRRRELEFAREGAAEGDAIRAAEQAMAQSLSRTTLRQMIDPELPPAMRLNRPQTLLEDLEANPRRGR
jgi:membrane protein